jgi:hypothetical protein
MGERNASACEKWTFGTANQFFGATNQFLARPKNFWGKNTFRCQVLDGREVE